MSVTSELDFEFWYRFFVPLVGLWVGHYGMCTFLQYMIHSGKWQRYSLVRNRNITTKILLKHIGVTTLDLCILLPIIFYFTMPYLLQQPGATPKRATFEDLDTKAMIFSAIHLLQVVPVFYISRIWAMAVHRILHTELLYQKFHIQHHALVEHLGPFNAFTSSMTEFLTMELIGTFLIGPFLLPLTPELLAIYWGYQGIAAAIDHSGIYVDDAYGGFIDGRYHFVHHKFPLFNFAETDILDKICGTYKELKKST